MSNRQSLTDGVPVRVCGIPEMSPYTVDPVKGTVYGYSAACMMCVQYCRLSSSVRPSFNCSWFVAAYATEGGTFFRLK